MLRERWTRRSAADLQRIWRFWAADAPELFPDVHAAVRARVRWLAAGNHQLGRRIPHLGPEFRRVLERRFGYWIFYRLDGEPPHTLVVFAVRHGRQRPLRPRTLARYSRS